MPRDAFLRESGTTLIRRHVDLGDTLFTPDGYREYAEDLLERMVNPYLNDLTERVGRDHLRKLGYTDRLYGTMNLALDYDVEPRLLAMGAAAGVVCLLRRRADQPGAEKLPLPANEDALDGEALAKVLRALWGDEAGEHAPQLIELTGQGLEVLRAEGWLQQPLR